MDGKRHQYNPATSQQVQLPPRQQSLQSTQVLGMGPPSSKGYGPSSSQQTWEKPAIPANLPPPPLPPPPPPSLAVPSPYSRPMAPFPLPVVPSIMENHPLTSATYVPGPDSSIPQLEAHSLSLLENLYTPHEQGSTNRPAYRNDGVAQGHYVSSPLALHDNMQEAGSPNVLAGTSHNFQSQPAAGRGHESGEVLKHPNNTPLDGISSSEAAALWPLDRVLLWLAHNGFSNDWQETFKSLGLHGADFLELGQRSNGRPNFGRLHKVVYPQLAKECNKSGTGWDRAREFEEGKRLRRFIRRIHDDGDVDAGIPISRRQDSYQPPPLSASMPSDPGSEFSPVPSHGPMSAVSGFGATENSPGVSHTGIKRLSGGLGGGASGGVNGGQIRAVTLPVAASREAQATVPNQTEAMQWPRIRAVSASVGPEYQHQRQSSSISSDRGGAGAAFSGRQLEESPQSESPGTQQAFLGYSGLPPSTNETSFAYEHSRGSSGDSTTGLARNNAISSGRYYENRKNNHARSSPQESGPRAPGGEYPKEPSKGFLNLNFFKPKKKPAHTSPEEHGSESPTSPYARPHNITALPYKNPDYNASDISLGPASSDVPSTRARPVQKMKKWIFVTSDLLNYRLVDATDVDGVDTLRTVVCSKVGVFDWASAQIFLTEPGRSEHDEPLGDYMLWTYQLAKADPGGSLKLYVRVNNHSHIHPFMGVPITERLTPSPTAGLVQRKPLDDEAMSRILQQQQQQQQNQNVSPPSLLNPQQPVLNAQPTARDGSPIHPPAAPANDGASEAVQLLGPERADLLARHEEHQRDVERKQKEYRISKLPPVHSKRNDRETGFHREGIIDFDMPRTSPFDNHNEKVQTLIPRRKPPSAPPESHTLTKVNSLSKRRSGDRTQQPSSNRTSGVGLAAAVADVGKMTSLIGNPSPSMADTQSKISDSEVPNSGTVRSGSSRLSSGTFAPRGQLPLFKVQFAVYLKPLT